MQKKKMPADSPPVHHSVLPPVNTMGVICQLPLNNSVVKEITQYGLAFPNQVNENHLLE
jgi:hypothetical protein